MIPTSDMLTDVRVAGSTIASLSQYLRYLVLVTT
jgi:hypothetical protein